MRVISPNPGDPVLKPDYVFVRYVDGKLEATSEGATVVFDNDEAAAAMAMAILHAHQTKISREGSMTRDEYFRHIRDMHHRDYQWVKQNPQPPYRGAL